MSKIMKPQDSCFFLHSLRDTMYAHLESYELDKELPNGFEDNFPETITLKQSVTTWEVIVFHQERHEQEINEQ